MSTDHGREQPVDWAAEEADGELKQ